MAEATTSAASGTAVTPAPSLLESIWHSIITPGVGPGLLASINAALLTLVATLAVAMLADFSIHYVVLLVLGLGLLGSVNWCVAASSWKECNVVLLVDHAAAGVQYVMPAPIHKQLAQGMHAASMHTLLTITTACN